MNLSEWQTHRGLSPDFSELNDNFQLIVVAVWAAMLLLRFTALMVAKDHIPTHLVYILEDLAAKEPDIFSQEFSGG